MRSAAQWVRPPTGGSFPWPAADNNGGVLAFSAFPTDTQTYLSSVSKAGVELWRTATPKAIFSKYAVHPDGTVFYLQVPTSPITAAQVIALNPTTGQPKFSVSLPESTTTTTGIRAGYQNPTTGQFYTICDPANSVTTQQVGRFGGLVIDGDGKLWVSVVANVTNKSVSCTQEVDQQGNLVPWDGSGTSYSYTSSVYLVSVTSAGASSTAQLDSSFGSGTSWSDPMPRFNLRNAIIPDGAGGVLVSVVKPDLSNPIYRSSGVQYDTPLSSVDQMLLGENGTMFADSQLGGVAALDLATGTPTWTYPNATLYAAREGGGVAVKSGNNVALLDATGQAEAGFPTDFTFYEPSYWTLASWNGALGDGRFMFFVGPNLPTAVTEFGLEGGNAQKQKSPHIPEIVNYLPSHVEAAASEQLTTAAFPCWMDQKIFNTAGQYGATCAPPSDTLHRANQHYRLRQDAIVQTFRRDVQRPLDALAFVGHSTVFNLGSPNEFSTGINFYYPNAPGKHPGDESTWDITYYQGDIIGNIFFQNLYPECFPPSDSCGQQGGPSPENKLLTFQKDKQTVQGLDVNAGVWQYSNDYVTTTNTPPSPGPPHPPLLLVDKLAQQAKVLFFGACALKPEQAQPNDVPVFLQMWDIHDSRFDNAETRERAIILPEGNAVNLQRAADAWSFILSKMILNKMTVQQAVDSANSSNSFPQRFVVYGNPNVRLR